MKRGIPIVLRAAGVLLACLATSLNHPVYALGTVAPVYDTAYYYNEQGEVLFCDPNGLGSFVIRTCKKKKEIYYDYYNIGSNKSGFKPIKVCRIGIKKAKRIEMLVIKGMVTDGVVKRNLVEILDKGSIRKMKSRIGDSGGNIDKDKDFCEYGGVVNEDSSLLLIIGNSADPCKEGVGLDVPKAGISDYHSHPSGENNKEGCYFIQGPSKVDQDALEEKKEEKVKLKRKEKEKIGYVFGMSRRSHLIYIYDKRGLRATLPFCFLLCDTVNK
jgi:hypothetical protein